MANAATITVSNTTQLVNVLGGSCNPAQAPLACFTTGGPNTLVVNASTDAGGHYTPGSQLAISASIASGGLTIQGPSSGAGAIISGASETAPSSGNFQAPDTFTIAQAQT